MLFAHFLSLSSYLQPYNSQTPFLSSPPTFFLRHKNFPNSNKTQIQIPFLVFNPKDSPLYSPHSGASSLRRNFFTKKEEKEKKNVAVVLHCGFLCGSSDPLRATNPKPEPVCGNHGICCQRIKNLQESSLPSPTRSLV